MPNGRIHTASTLALATMTIPFMSPSLTLGVVSGCVLSPDLDCDMGYIGLHHFRRIPFVGPFLSGLWGVFWWPYSKMVPHRSHISHSIFFGTCVRVAYLLFPVLVINALGVPLHLSDGFGWWFIGLCLADALHIFMDKI